MDLGNFFTTSYLSPYGDCFDTPCWHVRSQYGSGNFRPCLKCGLICQTITLVNCTHCHQYNPYTEYFIFEGEWKIFPNGEEGYNDGIAYICAVCDKITINPEIQYTEKWINPSSNK